MPRRKRQVQGFFRARAFNEGLSSRLMGIYCEGQDMNDMVLVRVYGDDTGHLISREDEKRNMQLFCQNGLGPEIYAEFKNGIAYAFVPGNILYDNDE